MRLRKTSIAVLIGAALAISAPVASAATSPVQQGYSTTAGVVQTEVNAKEQASGNDELPFTGLDVGLVGAAGAMLLAAGFGIRRLSRTTGTV